MQKSPKLKVIYKERYQRPEQKWVCGNASKGCPCPAGPDRRGRCSGFECIPAKVGDRWHCTRPDHYGGPCDAPGAESCGTGPIVRDGQAECCQHNVCVPQLSMRAKRGRLTALTVAIIVGAVFLTLGGQWRYRILNPGLLTVAHQGASHAAQDIGNPEMISENCNSCHDSFEAGLFSVLQRSFDSSGRTPQSQQCLVCHEDVAESPLNIHGQYPNRLAQLTTRAQSRYDGKQNTSLAVTLAGMMPGDRHQVEDRLACATCHKEHNGPRFDLARISEERCHSCHTIQFSSFNDGHPEFSRIVDGNTIEFPYSRRTQLIFDHDSHLSEYFLQSDDAAWTEINCSDCHVFEEEFVLPRLHSFETMCASCHDDAIHREPDTPLQLFGLPKMQTEILEEEGKEIDEYPQIARERPLSPFLMLLMSADDDYAGDDAQATPDQLEQDLAVIDEMFLNELFVLEVFEDESELDAAARVGSSIFRLYNEIADPDGEESPLLAALQSLQSASHERDFNFEAMLGPLADGKGYTRLTDAILEADLVTAEGFYVTEDGRESIRDWKPALSGSEEYVELVDALEQLEENPVTAFMNWFEDFEDFKDWFAENVNVEGDRWFAADTGKKLSNSSWKKLIEAAPGFDNFSLLEDTGAAEAGESFVKWITKQSDFSKWLDTHYRMTESGWLAADAPRSVFYRPRRHADPFLKEWLDYSTSLYFDNVGARLLFDDLSSRNSPNASAGTCIKCHSVEQHISEDGEQSLHVNWSVKPKEKSFTRFSHAPHLKLLDCAACHSLKDDDNRSFTYRDSFLAPDAQGNMSKSLGTNNRTFSSNFAPLTQESCASCHTPERAGNSCLTCHNYHVRGESILESSELPW